jgi:site-specific DNA recombinase
VCGAIIYVRVSTDGQEREGTSLDTQEEACLKYAESQNWTVVTRVHETGSGFSL